MGGRGGGVPEILQGGSGVEEFIINDENSVIEAINKVAVLSREELIEIGNKLKEHAIRKFDNEKIKRKLLGIFT